MKTEKKKKKKRKKKRKRKRSFLMDNVTNIFRRKRINQLSMYGNFQYEKIILIFILSIWESGVVYHIFVFLNKFFVFMHLLYRAEVLITTCLFRSPCLPWEVGILQLFCTFTEQFNNKPGPVFGLRHLLA